MAWEDEKEEVDDGEGEEEEEEGAPASPIGREREGVLARRLREAGGHRARGGREVNGHGRAEKKQSSARAELRSSGARRAERPNGEAVDEDERVGRERDSVGSDGVESEGDDAFEERAKAERSAIAFAMRSFEQGSEETGGLELSAEVMDELLATAEVDAVAEPVRSTTPSPPPTPLRSPSPDLPPLPPLVGSPSPVNPARRPRTPLHSSRDRVPDYSPPSKLQPNSAPGAQVTPPNSSPRKPVMLSPRKPLTTRSSSATRNDPATDPLIDLAASFTLAVRDLAASASAPGSGPPPATSVAELSSLGLPAPPPPTHLSQLLARRKHDSDVRRRALEGDMRALEEEAAEEERARAGVAARLGEVGREEGEVRARLGEAVEAVRRRRARTPAQGEAAEVPVPVVVQKEPSSVWRLLTGLGLQLACVWLAFRLASGHVGRAREPSFSRYLLAPSPGSFGVAYGHGAGVPRLLPETVRAFGDGAAAAASGGRGAGGRGGGEWLGRWGAGPATSRAVGAAQRRVPV